VGSGIGVVRTGGTKRREDINAFFFKYNFCHALCLHTFTALKYVNV